MQTTFHCEYGFRSKVLKTGLFFLNDKKNQTCLTIIIIIIISELKPFFSQNKFAP